MTEWTNTVRKRIKELDQRIAEITKERDQLCKLIDEQSTQKKSRRLNGKKFVKVITEDNKERWIDFLVTAVSAYPGITFKRLKRICMKDPEFKHQTHDGLGWWMNELVKMKKVKQPHAHERIYQPVKGE